MYRLSIGPLLFSATALALPILVDSAIKSCLVLAIAGIAACILYRTTASLRHVVWLTAIVGSLLLPVLSLLLPQWQILPTWLDASHLAKLQGNIPSTIRTESDLNSSMDPSADDQMKFEMGVGLADSHARFGQTRETSAAPLAGRSTKNVPTLSTLNGLATVSFAIWFCGVLVFCVRLLLSQLCLGRLTRGSEVITRGRLHNMLTASCRNLNIDHSVRLLISNRREVPMTWGVVKATILLPREARSWSNNRLRAVLLHELAHVTRRDAVAQLAVQFACALYWFNPLIWWAAWWARRERENACDDIVLNHHVKASAYAEHLVSISTGFSSQSLAHVSGLTMAESFTLEGRLMRILDPRVNRRGESPLAALLCCVATVAALFVVAALHAGEVTVDDSKHADREIDFAENGGETLATEQTAVIDDQADRQTVGAVASATVDHVESSAEDALQELGARVHRNDDGEVISVGIDNPEFGNDDITLLCKLNWSKKTESHASRNMNAFHDYYFPWLHLKGTQVTAAGIQSIHTIAPRIRSLYLVNNKAVKDDALESVRSFRNLKQLAVWRTGITDDGLDLLVGRTQLESLAIGSTMITDAGLARLKDMANLKDLGIRKTNTTDQGLKHLIAMKNLRRLDVSNTKMTDTGMEYLSRMTNLTWLAPPRITDTGLPRLKGATNLKVLNMVASDTTDRGLAHISEMTNLRQLRVPSSIGDEGLAHLKDLAELEALYLTSTEVTSAGLVNLIGLSRLTNLRLNSTEIADEGLAHLKGLTRLERLELKKTGISDKGLTHLEGLTNLRWLDLSGTRVSVEAVKKLEQTLPKCRIRLASNSLDNR